MTTQIKLAYVGGRVAAMRQYKLGGMDLEFENAEQARKHMKTRGQIGAATGFAGNIAGGMAGGMAGTAAGGPAGGIAGSLAGGAAGEALVSMPFTTAYDGMHDLKYRANKAKNQTISRLNAAGGMPTANAPGMKTTPLG